MLALATTIIVGTGIFYAFAYKHHNVVDIDVGFYREWTFGIHTNPWGTVIETSYDIGPVSIRVYDSVESD